MSESKQSLFEQEGVCFIRRCVLDGSAQICDESIKIQVFYDAKGENTMSRSLFLTIAAVLGVLFGLAFLLVPAQAMSMYGITLDTAGLFVARYMGSGYFGLGLIYWFARSADESTALRALLLGGFIFALAALGVALYDVFAGVGNSMVWSTVVIDLFLAAGNGYFYFKKP